MWGLTRSINNNIRMASAYISIWPYSQAFFQFGAYNFSNHDIVFYCDMRRPCC